MKPIKFYGESKTGTTYLQKLLELNVDADIIPGDPDSPLGWKHGFPQSGDVTYVFIFRGIYQWAKSLKSDTIDKRFQGIDKPFGGNYKHWQKWDNPIRCRTAKYYSYIGFAKLHDAIFISLEWLRKDYYAESLFLALEQRNYKMESVFQDIPNHTYIDTKGRDNPNRKELTQSEIDFIDSQKDPTLETWVDNLTIYG